MALSLETLAMAKTYTNETVIGGGAIKGKNCRIQSVVHENGRNTVTFLWVLDDGTERTSQMVVLDGTPIYEWQSGDSYEYGNLVIYASCFYRCITPNQDISFDATKWNEIGSPDGNYDIVEDASLLPVIFTAADRKMYFSINDEAFYLWNGQEWVLQRTCNQYAVMPTPASIFTNRVVQYIGPTTEQYSHGLFYECDGSKWTKTNVSDIDELTNTQVNSIIAILNEHN